MSKLPKGLAKKFVGFGEGVSLFEVLDQMTPPDMANMVAFVASIEHWHYIVHQVI